MLCVFLICFRLLLIVFLVIYVVIRSMATISQDEQYLIVKKRNMYSFFIPIHHCSDTTLYQKLALILTDILDCKFIPHVAFTCTEQIHSDLERCKTYSVVVLSIVAWVNVNVFRFRSINLWMFLNGISMLYFQYNLHIPGPQVSQ